MTESKSSTRIHQFRRVVVGEDASGTSSILADSMIPVIRGTANYLQIAELWRTEGRAGEIPGTKDAAVAEPTDLIPPPGATRLVIEVVHPDTEARDEKAIETMFQSIGASASRTFQGANAHPGMHRTNSVDYIYIISGEIYVILDKQQLLLRAGDTLIDAGANHSWANRSGKPCIMLAAIVGAQRP